LNEFAVVNQLLLYPQELVSEYSYLVITSLYQSHLNVALEELTVDHDVGDVIFKLAGITTLKSIYFHVIIQPLAFSIFT
jgi:hypothetical protein